MPRCSDAAPIDEGNRLQAFFYALQECLRSALGSIRSHRMRSFLTMLGVIIGVASVICVVSLLQGLTQSVMNEFQGMGGNTLQIHVGHLARKTGCSASATSCGPTDLELLKYRVAGISNVTPMAGVNLPGGVRNGSNTAAAQVIAHAPLVPAREPVLSARGPLHHRQRRRMRGAASWCSARRLRADLKLPEDPLGTFIQVGSEWFKIVGVMEARGELFGQSLDNYIVMPFETGGRSAGPSNEPDMAIMVTVDDLDAVEDVNSRITALMRRAHKIGAEDPDDFKVESSQSLTEDHRARFAHHHRS